MDTSGRYVKGTGVFEIKEFSAQDSVLKELENGKQFWECTSAGTFAEKQPYAYGSGRFWLYKGGDVNSTDVHFISNKVDISGVGGYHLFLTTTERVQLNERNIGIKFATISSYIENNIWYEIEWDRTLDGTFTIRIRGGAFGNTWILIDVTGGSGSNPVLDNTYTESIYQVLDLDVGDRYIPGVQRQGVKQ